MRAPLPAGMREALSAPRDAISSRVYRTVRMPCFTRRSFCGRTEGRLGLNHTENPDVCVRSFCRQRRSLQRAPQTPRREQRAESSGGNGVRLRLGSERSLVLVRHLQPLLIYPVALPRRHHHQHGGARVARLQQWAEPCGSRWVDMMHRYVERH